MKKIVFVFIMIGVFAGCNGNLYGELADKNSDDALIFDAKTAVNAQDYDGAINILTVQLSANGQLKTEAREVLASAYAGKCGLNFVNYVDALAAASSGSAFQLAAAPFVGLAVNSNYCLMSLHTLDLIGPNTSRTTDQNAFAAVVGMVLMGTSTRTATDDIPSLGDGTQDAPNISCDTVTVTDAEVDQIILGYGYMSTNLAALTAAQIGNSSSGTFTSSTAICDAAIQAINGPSATCKITDAAQITTQLRDTMRDLLNTVEYGVGTADGSNPLLIPVACP